MARKYNDKPFHNFYHGFAVLQHIYLTLQMPEVTIIVVDDTRQNVI